VNELDVNKLTAAPIIIECSCQIIIIFMFLIEQRIQ